MASMNLGNDDSFLIPLRQFIEEKEGLFSVYGLKGSSPAFLISKLAARTASPFFIIAPEEREAELIFQEISFFLGSLRPLLYYPDWDIPPFGKISPPLEVMGQRWQVRQALISSSASYIIVTSLPAILWRVPPRHISRQTFLKIRPGQEISQEELMNKLAGMGYSRQSLVTARGEYSGRGQIIDIYSPATSLPCRLEFFGDTVESIRIFDPETQRSLQEEKETLILPVRETLLFPEFSAKVLSKLPTQFTQMAEGQEIQEKIKQGMPFPGMENYLPFFYPQVETIFDYLPPAAIVFLVEPPEIKERLTDFWEMAQTSWAKTQEEIGGWPPPEELIIPAAEFEENVSLVTRISLQSLEILEKDLSGFSLTLETESNENLRSSLLTSKSEEGVLHALANRIRQEAEKGVFSVFVCTHHRSAQQLAEMLDSHGLESFLFPESFSSWHPPASMEGQVTILIGQLSRGFNFPKAQLFIIAEADIFGAKKLRKKRLPFREEHALATFSELKEGDFVVHTDHGIGVYRGLVKFSLGEEEQDFLLLEYQGGDKLYLPVYRLNLVHKYIGSGDGEPRLDKLGGTSWEKAKKKVKKFLQEMAAELVQLYAARAVIKRPPFSPGGEYLKEFEASFEFEETPDQLQAIEDVQADLDKEKPMDRLICGDVGFGKTEIALRAALRVMMEGKQVAVLVPTTVLAQQHYQNFSRRFAPYPLRIEMLSRFRSPAQQKEIICDLVRGKIDLIIGTHRLLQRDVTFKDLGLLVIDEEHRFGVRHKERLKQMKANVDVLTLTATPIPRTLQMSLGGIRDLSVIQTPPENRLSIRTYITEFDEDIIREAIRRELRRGGQIFFVHNRVQSIPAMEKFLGRLVPEVRLGIAHGQMAERELEKVMLAFLKKEIDLLLTTTIIESGLDFPTANTIIINRADKLGLAQMYQLRGRVGRAQERAYAYLLIPGLEVIGREARKRLEALREVTELGSGFKLAMHDLEIRGAGNILGDAQSGHIAAVGFDMYLQILEEAVRELKGEEVVVEVEPEIDLPLPAYIPADYIGDINQRLVFYRRLSTAKTEEEIAELAAELKDRFGSLPSVLENLLEIMYLKLILKKGQIRRLATEKGKIVLTFDAQAVFDPQKLVAFVAQGKGRREFTPDQRLKVSPDHKGGPGLLWEIKKLLLELLEGVNIKI
ncbi:MAG: transcription-repair coupling factor [Thermodesulfobacteriota bacterium]